MRTQLNFNHLECFLVVARLLSFSQAAQELKIAQPAVSKHIKALEDTLGTPLFLRNNRSVVLTERGKELYARTLGPFQEVCQQVEDFMHVPSVMQGTVRFGCLAEVGEKVFMKAVSLYRHKFPQVNVETGLMTTQAIEDALVAGEIDVGIVASIPYRKDLIVEEILGEEIVLVTSSKGQLDEGRKVGRYNYISYRAQDPLLSLFIKKLDPHFPQAKLMVSMTVNSHRSMVDLLIDHPNLYGVLPKRSVEDGLKSGKLVLADKRTLKTKLYMLRRDLGPGDRKVQSFCDVIRNHVGALT